MSAPSPFVSDSTFQWAWDSTSLGWLKTCPRLYEYNMVLGLRARESEDASRSEHLIFGIAFHYALQRYDMAIASGADYESALRTAVQATFQSLWDQLGKPWESLHAKKNVHTLVRSVVWYLEHWRNDNATTVILADGSPAVELSFQFQPGITVNGVSLDFIGHLDRVVNYSELTLIHDRKTTVSGLGAYYFDKYSPDNQVSFYTLAGKVVFMNEVQGLVIDAAQILIGSTAFARGFATRSDSQLEEWLHDTKLHLENAGRYAEQGYYPQNDTACDKYGGCFFRKVCDKSPLVRQSFIDTHFEHRPWNPLEKR